MPGRAIAFDLTRLITRLRHARPTGIDRVDLAYARHYLGGDGPRFGLVSTGLGVRVVDRDAALGIVEAVEAGWVENASAQDDSVYAGLVAALGGAATVRAEPGRAGRSDVVRRRRLQAATTLRMLRSGGEERLPEGTIYLHSSHLRLDKPDRFDWLYSRKDIRPVFFVHDLIPITHPEYGREGEAARHAMRIATVARHAAHVLVNSTETAERFAEHLARHGFGKRPVTVAPLGVEPAFRAREPAPPRLPHPVFVVCGTIETRKNHMLLLNLWRELAGTHGPGTPRLVLVGRRGWEAENVFDMLERCPALQGPVLEVSGLTTPGLALLMRGASALLMPSFVEGYGLPVVEAAASGLPVIASDIPAHREVADGFGHFLDPLDGPGWRAAIEALSEPGSQMRAELKARLDRYEPPTWPAHFEGVDATLDRLGAA